MSVKGTSPKNSESITQPLRDGEEPTELLLSLIASPLMTLKDRGAAQVYEAKDGAGNPVVLAIFPGVQWDEAEGLLPAGSVGGALAVPASVGNPYPGALAVEGE